MSYGGYLRDRCAIYRYGEVVENDITDHRPVLVRPEVRCRLIQKSTRSVTDSGRTRIINTYTLLLGKSVDIEAGDLVQVNGEVYNKKPVYLKAEKPAQPHGRHRRVLLNEEVER